MSIVSVGITHEEIDFVTRMAKEAQIGGKSWVYLEREERLDKLKESSLTGQIGEFAINKYWFGHAHYYYMSRYYRNQMKHIGDGGVDVPPLNVDVKCSLDRYNKGAKNLTLIVPQREYHDDWIYILAIAYMLEKGIRVDLVGWCASKNLLEPGHDDRFPNKYTKAGIDLLPMMPIRPLWIGK